jgi:hypothetical protein
MYVHCYLVCPDIVTTDLFSADTAAVIRALHIMKNVAASSRFFEAPNQYWDNNVRSDSSESYLLGFLLCL